MILLDKIGKINGYILYFLVAYIKYKKGEKTIFNLVSAYIFGYYIIVAPSFPIYESKIPVNLI